jgi:uncharacterized protein (TIGR03437 family)
VAGTGVDAPSGPPWPTSGLALLIDLNFPTGLAVDGQGDLFIADLGNFVLRELSPNGPTTPTIGPLGVVPADASVASLAANLASLTEITIQPGSWVSIYGVNLSAEITSWKGDFPTSLGGSSVTINGKPAFLSYVSPTQINLQAPDDTTTGIVSVVVKNSLGSGESTTNLAPLAPSFLTFADGFAAAIILTPDGSGAYGGGTYDLDGPPGLLPFNTRIAKPGETLVVFGTGFGATNPFVPAGQVFVGSAPTVNPVTVDIGAGAVGVGVPANVLYSGITEAGVYQINLTMPDVGTGAAFLEAFVGGVQVNVQIQ